MVDCATTEQCAFRNGILFGFRSVLSLARPTIPMRLLQIIRKSFKLIFLNSFSGDYAIKTPPRNAVIAEPNLNVCHRSKNIVRLHYALTESHVGNVTVCKEWVWIDFHPILPIAVVWLLLKSTSALKNSIFFVLRILLIFSKTSRINWTSWKCDSNREYS